MAYVVCEMRNPVIDKPHVAATGSRNYSTYSKHNRARARKLRVGDSGLQTSPMGEPPRKRFRGESAKPVAPGASLNILEYGNCF